METRGDGGHHCGPFQSRRHTVCHARAAHRRRDRSRSRRLGCPYDEPVAGQSTLSASFNATLLASFATLSLLLAAAGLFGVLSYMATERMREIGIRIALGAQRQQVLQLMLVDGIRPAMFGLASGLAIGVAASRLLRSMLYETQTLDAAVFAAVAILLLFVAIIACMLPAWRASRLDAMEALRTE